MQATDVPNPRLPVGAVESLVLPFGVALACAVLVLAGFGLLRLLLRFDDFRWGRGSYAARLAAYLVLLVGAGVLGWHWHESAIQAAPILPGFHIIESVVSDLFVLVGLLLGAWAAKAWLTATR